MEYIKLANIVRIIPGYAIPSNCMTGRGTPIIKITNIKADNTLDLQNTVRYNQPISSKLRKFILKSKDILVCMTGATIGKIARQIEVGENYIVNQRVAIIRPENPDDFDYVYYALTTSAFRRYVELVGYGAAQPNISGEAIGDFRLNYDSRQEKRKTIGGMLFQYDVLIANNNRRIRILEQMAENLYKEWFSYEKIQKVSSEVRFGEIIQIVRGLSYSTEEIDVDKGINLINLKNIQSFGGFRHDGTKLYAGKYKREQVVDCGNLIMGVTDMTQDRRTVGSVALVPKIDGISVISADLIKILSKIDNVFLFAMFKYGNVSKYISQFANGANVLHLRPQAVLNIKVMLPPQDIIDKYICIAKPLFNEIEQLNQTNQNLIKQRDMLLPRLMSGKLEV